jgi:hypothetical protein
MSKAIARAREVLLVPNTLVQSDENVKTLSFCGREKLAILLAGKSAFRHRAAFVTG